MSKFLTNLEGVWIDDTRFVLTKPLIYQSDILAKETSIKEGILNVVVGFTSDFASVPRVPVIYFAFGDRAHHESVLHDALYKTGTVSRKMADAVFLEAMKARGKKWWIRTGMWLGVRLGGYGAWKRHRNRDIKS